MIHNKPTKEELDQKIKESLEVLDKKPEDPKPTPEVPTPSVPVPSPSTPVPSPSKPIDPEPSKKPEDPKPTPEVPTPSSEYKKRYRDSSREAQVLYSSNKKFIGAIEKMKDIPEPTEAELVEAYPDWDVMSEFEKKLAKKDMINDRKFKLLDESTTEFKDAEAWKAKVDDFITDPRLLIENPKLEGKEEEFKDFVSVPTRRGVDFGDLVKAFLYEVGTKAPEPKKGEMFPTGTGGDKTPSKPKSDKISIAEANILRAVDYKKYVELLKANKIESAE